MTDNTLAPHLDQLIKILESLAPTWFKKQNINIYSIVGLATAVIEKYSSIKTNLDSDQKLELLLKFLPVLADQLVRLNIINTNQAASLKNFASEETVKNLVTLIVTIANNPNSIQANTWVKSTKSLCC